MNTETLEVNPGLSKEEYRDHLTSQIESLAEAAAMYRGRIREMEQNNPHDPKLDVTKMNYRSAIYILLTNIVTLHNIDVAWQHVSKHFHKS